MRTSGQYCPVVAAAEILADRWTLLIVHDPIKRRAPRRGVGAGHQEYWLTAIGADLEPAVFSLRN